MKSVNDDDLITIKQQLEQYAQELDVASDSLTITSLINSHRFLRLQFKQDREERIKEINARVKLEIQHHLTYNYIDIKEFFKLPLQEIINRYYENECSA